MNPQQVCRNTKLRDAADMTEIRDALQSDLDRLEKRIHMSEVQQGQVQRPTSGSGQPLVSVQTRGGMNGKQPHEEGLRHICG